jgi:branched-subunit amino acid aminotransferase/4-amino-4-deoxychorismate lyase
LLTANGLSRGPARVKILLTRGVAEGLGLPKACRPTLVIYAQPYIPPSSEEYAAGWPVVIFPEGRSTFVGRHKSLNYLFYLAARQFALDQGAKEALILEADGLVSEGAATSLIFLHQGQYYQPASASALSGVTATVLGRGLAARGLALKARRTTVAHLIEADGLWLANSLMGLMPVAAVNGAPVPVSAATAFLQEVLADMS